MCCGWKSQEIISLHAKSLRSHSASLFPPVSACWLDNYMNNYMRYTGVAIKTNQWLYILPCSSSRFLIYGSTAAQSASCFLCNPNSPGLSSDCVKLILQLTAYGSQHSSDLSLLKGKENKITLAGQPSNRNVSEWHRWYCSVCHKTLNQSDEWKCLLVECGDEM